jgi:hypothetical protein
MQAGRPKRITIELDSSEEPIRGSIDTPRDDVRRFVGWLELAQAIETVRVNGATGSGNEQPNQQAQGHTQPTPAGHRDRNSTQQPRQ